MVTFPPVGPRVTKGSRLEGSLTLPCCLRTVSQEARTSMRVSSSILKGIGNPG